MFASLRRRLDDLFNPVHMLEADVQPPPLSILSSKYRHRCPDQSSRAFVPECQRLRSR